MKNEGIEDVGVGFCLFFPVTDVNEEIDEREHRLIPLKGCIQTVNRTQIRFILKPDL